MANRDYLALESGNYKVRPSNLETIDYVSVRIGADLLELKQTGSGGSAYFDVSGRRIGNGAAPVNDTDYVTKAYADAISQGFIQKAPCLYKTTANIASILSANAATVQAALDTVSAAPPSLVTNDRILVDSQSTASENGIYRWTGSALVRALDADANGELKGGVAVWVTAGDVYADTGWVISSPNGDVTVGTDSVVWTQYTGASQVIAGAGLTKTGNTIDFVAGDNSLTVNANDVVVKRDSAGAIGLVAGGIKINLEASNPSLQISSNELGVKLDPAGAIIKNANGVALNVGYGLELVANAVQEKTQRSFTNNEGATTMVIRDFVYEDTFGTMKLVRADVAGLKIGTKFGMVADASIAAAASGAITIKPGTIVSGFTGLSVGPVYASRTAFGGYVQTIPALVSGEKLILIGMAISSSEIEFNPAVLAEY